MKIGDKVKIKIDTYFYDTEWHPTDILGQITDTFGPSFLVEWENDTYGYYIPEDLRIVNLQLA